MRQWLGWCRTHALVGFQASRAHIELFARWLEENGRTRATVARRLSTITGFYRYCVEEQLIPRSPAVHIRRPKLNYESNAVGLDRNELGMFLVQAGLSGGRDHALACLLALNGLRISEALNADIEDLGLERGHRTLTITRKGGKVVTVPLAPRTARAIDIYVGERSEGPIFQRGRRRTRRRQGGNVTFDPLGSSSVTSFHPQMPALRSVIAPSAPSGTKDALKVVDVSSAKKKSQ